MAITRTQIARQLLQFGGGADASKSDFGGNDKNKDRDRRDDYRANQYKKPPTKEQLQRARNFRDTQKVKQAFTKETIFDKIPSGLGVLTKMSKFNPKFMKEFAASNPDLLDYINSLDEDDQSSAKLASALKEIGYGDFLADVKGAPGLKFAGNVGGLGTKSAVRDIDGNIIGFKYDEPRDDRGGPDILLPQGIMTQAPSITEQEPEEDEGLRLAFRANGGRIGFQGGGKDLGAGASGMGSGGKDRNRDPDARDRRRVEQYTRPPKPPTGGGGDETPDTPIQADPRFSFGKNIGKGLPPKELARFFNEFYGLPNPDDEENETITAGAEEGINISDVRTDPLASFIRNQPEFQSKIQDTVSGIMANPDIANLGKTGFAVGGLADGNFDFENARQMYGLGKLVKKVTRTVKKIAKSPIGKAALIGGGLGLAGIGPMAPLFSSGKGLAFKQLLLGGKTLPPSMGFKSKGLLGLIKANPFTSIAAVSALAGLLTPAQEEEAQELARGEGIDIEAARRSILNAGTAQDFRARRFVAEGGSMKEPVAKKTMPLLDMGGKEMDLRAEGGFVPIGRMEKADDVPARLSKNEFVFTADAVRNAGDGDVDKGAEVMYNMMKNLEAGGDVSEESQGLKGARRMFQTSQRLEEVL